MADSPTQADDLRQSVKLAVTQMRSGLQWKPGKGQAHLAKRIARGDLPQVASLADYEAVIAGMLASSAARVYVFRFAETIYPAVVADHAGRLWIVMFSLDRILEIAFPPDDPVAYFRDEPRYVELGSIEEVMA